MPAPYHVRLAISRYGDQFRVELFTESLGDTPGYFFPSFMWENEDETAETINNVPFKAWLKTLADAPLLPHEAGEALGKSLFKHLFPTHEIYGKWKEVEKHAQERGMSVRLLIDAAEDVAALPFGLLYDPLAGNYLLRADPPRVQLVRVLRQCPPRRLNLRRKPLRVLLAAAEPTCRDFPAVGCAACVRDLARSLSRWPMYQVSLCRAEGDRVAVSEGTAAPKEGWQVFSAVTRAGLKRALREGDFEILHLIAHGYGDGVVLCDRANGRENVLANELGELCKPGPGKRLEMVFLQVCYASDTGGRGSFGGVAQELLNPKGGDVAAVVASPFPVEPAGSTEAAISFYGGLAAPAVDGEGPEDDGEEPEENPDALLSRQLPINNWAWAFLEMWARPGALGKPGDPGTFTFPRPYRGLSRFEERDSQIFYGREKELAELTDRVSNTSVVAVFGESGSGKSSLLHAGLAGTVRRHGLAGLNGWRIVSLRPGNQPAPNLLDALGGDERHDQSPVEQIVAARQELHGGLSNTSGQALAAPLPQEKTAAIPPADLNQWLAKLVGRLRQCVASGPVLILFDQFEELFTLNEDHEQRLAVARALAQTVSEDRKNFRLVIGVRSDHLGSVAALPDWNRLLGELWPLKPPDEESIKAIIKKPAEIHGYNFEGGLKDGNAEHTRRLEDRILNDAVRSLEGSGRKSETGIVAPPLPLLEFALEQLWFEAVKDGRNEFRHKDYEGIGRLGGAIAKHADNVYQALPGRFKGKELGGDPQLLAKQILTSVASFRGTRRLRSRAEVENETKNATAARRILDHLVAERLLTVRSGPGATAQVEIAHEVLIKEWKQLKEWLDEHERRTKEEFQEDAGRWQHDSAYRPHADTARIYLAWVSATDPSLTEAQKQFVQMLQGFVARRKWAARGAFATAVTAAVVMAALALYVRSEQKKTQRQLAFSHIQRGVTLCENYHAVEGMLYLLRGFEVAEDDTGLRAGAQNLMGGWGRSLGVCLRHDGQVRAVAFSPDGRTVLTGSVDDTARLWDAATGQPRGEPLRHGGYVTCIAFSPDGNTVLTGSSKTARLWEVATGRLLGELRHKLAVRMVAFSPDGRTVLTGSAGNPEKPGEALLWDAATAQGRGDPMRHGGAVTAVAFSPDGKTVLTASLDGTARLWDAANGQPRGLTLKHDAEVFAATFSPDGKTVLTGSLDKTARLWDAATGQPRKKPLQHENWVTTVAFSPDGKTALTGSRDRSAQLWDVETGQPRGQPMVHEGSVTAVAFSPDGKTVLTGSDDHTARLWDAATGQPSGELTRHQDAVHSVAFSPDGQTVLTGSDDHTARLQEAVTGQPRGQPLVHEAGVKAVAFSPDGKTVLTASLKEPARLWDAATGQPREPSPVQDDQLEVAAFSPDGKTVLTGRFDNMARLWDVTTGQARGDPLLHKGIVTAVAYSRDGQTVLTGSWDQTARLWDAATGKPRGDPLQHKGSVTAVAFSADGKMVLTGSEDKALLWDAATGHCRGQPFVHPGKVEAAAFSPDGKTVLTGTARSALLWDAATGQRRGEPLLHEGKVEAVAFSPDGRTVLTGSDDRRARLWDAATGQPRGEPLPHKAGVDAVAFSPDGKTLLTGSWDNTAQLWGLSTVPDKPEVIRLWIEVCTSRRWDERGVLVTLSYEEWLAARQRLDELGGPPITLGMGRSGE
jgi:WD40 repeat protein